MLNKIAKLLAALGDLLKKLNLKKIKDGVCKILDEILEMIQKHAPEIGTKLRKLFCDKLNLACFVAGTQIHTQVGLIPIEAIREGDLVWSKNPETGEVGIKRVESVSRREAYITYVKKYFLADQVL